MHTQQSELHSSWSAKKWNAISPQDWSVKDYDKLNKAGIHLGKTSRAMDANIHHMMERTYAMDALQGLVTQPSVTVPVQFLQMWLPGFVHVITAARRIDDLIGMQVMGNWIDEQVVQGLLEETGLGIPYGDYQNTPYASFNANFVYRTVIRFELGMRVGMLEEARSARINIDNAASKRGAAALNLEIQRNLIGYNGYNSGLNNTYGVLNDPGLPNYYTVPAGAALSTHWSSKTMLEICADIRTAVENLRTQSKDQIDPERVDLTLGLPTAVVDYLTTISDFGYSVRAWMKDTYPRMRVVSQPEFDGANGGANVGYLFADKVDDASTDGGSTWLQPVPSKFLILGVAKYEKWYTEDYLNATAGALLKRPYAVIRFSGI